jgi:hypothetical protein
VWRVESGVEESGSCGYISQKTVPIPASLISVKLIIPIFDDFVKGPGTLYGKKIKKF